MKKNFKWMTALAVAVAATSCSQDDLMGGLENNAQDNGAIGVSTFIANGTRGVAYDNVDEFREANGNFDLYAWEKLADGNFDTDAFMDGVAFVMGTDNPSASTWYYEDKGEVRFWQELQDGSTVDFYAVSPKDVAANIGSDAQTIDYTVASESKDQVDLMYARTKEVEPNDDVKKNGVHLDFNHALSQIVFKAKTREDYVDYVSAEIKEVKVVNVANSGTFAFGDASYPVEEGGTYNDEAKQPWSNVDGTAEYTAQIGWTEAEGTEGTTTIMPVNTDLNGEETVLTNSQSALILMPQTTAPADVYDRYTAPSEGAYFAVTCQVVYHRPAETEGGEPTPVYIVGKDSEDENVKYKTLYFPLETTWNAGYKYTYTFVFSADVADPITINEDLYVGPWGDGGNTDVPGEEEPITGEDPSTNLLWLNTYRVSLFQDEEFTLSTQATMPALLTDSDNATLSFTSGDENIATVNGNGLIKAIKPGVTTIEVTGLGYDDTSVDVIVMPTIKEVTLTSAIKTVKINAGTFSMGKDYENEYLLDAPSHNVTIDDDYYLGQYEISVAQYLEFVNANTDALAVYNEDGIDWIAYACDDESVEEGKFYIKLCEMARNNITGTAIGSLSVDEEYKNKPVRCEWEGAACFAKSVGGQLPTEEEWEYAAKSGLTGKYAWWQDALRFVDNDFSLYLPDVAEGETSTTTLDDLLFQVAEYENFAVYEIDSDEPTFVLRDIETTTNGSSWGLHDLFGNVGEWCNNTYYNYVGGVPDETNYTCRDFDIRIVKYDNLIQLTNFGGVASRNINSGGGNGSDSGIRMMFKSDYNGSNMSVQTVNQ